MKPKERIIYDNYDLDYDGAKEYLHEQGNEDPTESEIWAEANFQDEINWYEIKAELENVFNDGNFLAVGTCGRWNGNFAGGFIFETFQELMNHFSDCDYIKFWDENGHFYLKGTHHDGTHHVEIKEITKKGKDYYDNWDFGPITDKRTEMEIHKKMFSDSHYTKLINYAHKYYGCKRREFVA